MDKVFEEIEFTPEDIYEELLKAGIEIDLNEEYKYLETITLTDKTVEEINKLIEEGNKPVKKPFPYRNIESITIDEVGNWTIKGDKI